jgi:hypothetical protein
MKPHSCLLSELDPSWASPRYLLGDEPLHAFQSKIVPENPNELEAMLTLAAVVPTTLWKRIRKS